MALVIFKYLMLALRFLNLSPRSFSPEVNTVPNSVTFGGIIFVLNKSVHFTLKTEAVFSPRTLVSIFQTTWRHGWEEHKIGISFDRKLLLSPKKTLRVLPAMEQFPQPNC
jgi:glucose-6-phosphate-specific signal transduction histidine kinase